MAQITKQSSEYNTQPEKKKEQKEKDDIGFMLWKKNGEKIMKRHQEVEKDRIDAENRNAAVTSGCGRIVYNYGKQKSYPSTLPIKRLPKRVREWDEGKSDDPQFQLRSPRPPKRRIAGYTYYGYNKRSGNSRETKQAQDSFNKSRNDEENASYSRKVKEGTKVKKGRGINIPLYEKLLRFAEYPEAMIRKMVKKVTDEQEQNLELSSNVEILDDSSQSSDNK